MVERARHYRTATKDSLTPRQREVLQMVADGRTNPEIAERLGITLDGAKFHIREILSKLGVNSREEAADWWRAERGLGQRVASWARLLAPAGWLKPTAIGTAIGGTTFGLVAAVMAVNGGGGGAEATVGACEVTDIHAETREAEWPDTAVKTYVLGLWADEPCRFEGEGWASLIEEPPPPNPISGPGRGLVMSTIREPITIDLDESPQAAATAIWANWCKDSTPTSIQFDLQRQLDIDAAHETGFATSAEVTDPPACGDPSGTPHFAVAVHNEVLPLCNGSDLSWDIDVVPDTSSLRYAVSIETARKCLLETTITVALHNQDGSQAAAEGSPVGLSVAQAMGLGGTPVVTGTIKNMCDTGLALGVTTNFPEARYVLLDGLEGACTDASQPASLTAEWIGNSPTMGPHAIIPVPADVIFQRYVVGPGDTLEGIAAKFGVSIGEIVAANPGLKLDSLQVGQVLRIPARATPSPTMPPPPPFSATPRVPAIPCDVRTGNCPIPQVGPCSFPGCLVAQGLLKDIDGWLALAVGRELLPGEPPGLYQLKTGTRTLLSIEDFRTRAGDYLRLSPTLIAIGDAQKNGVLDLLFLTADGRAFSIAIEPGANNTYPPIGITFWEAELPADGEQAETTFGSALYRRVPAAMGAP